MFALFNYVKLEWFPEFYTAVTSSPMSLNELMKSGERVFNLRRAFNVRHGCTKSEDRLPERLLREPDKRANGALVQLGKILPEYYSIRRWDPLRGIPKKEKLTELGFVDIAEEFWGDETRAQEGMKYD